MREDVEITTCSTSCNDNTTTATTSDTVQSLRCHQKDGGIGTRVGRGGRRGAGLGLELLLVVGVVVVNLRHKTLIVILVVIPVKLGSSTGRENDRSRGMRVRG
jgi:hypothetical protein